MMDAAYPIGFVGLGAMGEAMALTLVKAGTRLVWNRTRAKAEILAAAGADVDREAADVFAHSATVFLMLVDGGAIRMGRASPSVCCLHRRLRGPIPGCLRLNMGPRKTRRPAVPPDRWRPA
jgi:hypothetical protein